jgi:hypothetical protein
MEITCCKCTSKNTPTSSYILILLSVCDRAWEGGWTTTVSASARCTNQYLISTKHRNRLKGRNDGRIASLSHRTRGGYKNLPPPPTTHHQILCAPLTLCLSVCSSQTFADCDQGSRCGGPSEVPRPFIHPRC